MNESYQQTLSKFGTILWVLAVTIGLFGIGTSAEPYLLPIMAISLGLHLIPASFSTFSSMKEDYTFYKAIRASSSNRMRTTNHSSELISVYSGRCNRAHKIS